jgi:2-amino-4-hydroxy-6-hydroxymethyldihydropteridine diphosphokinase
MPIFTVYLALGANLGAVVDQLQQVLNTLENSPFIQQLKVSRFYRTAPVEVDSPHDFVNAVCCFQTSLTVNELFKFTQSIEIRLGKVPKPKIASRSIDIDLLFYGPECLHTDQLDIPHPRWKERLFVLYPLQDLTQEMTLFEEEGMKTYPIAHLIQKLTKEADQRISLLEKNPFLH